MPRHAVNKNTIAAIFVFLVAVALAAAASFLFSSSSDPEGKLVQIGEIVTFNGEISRRLPRATQFEPVLSPQPIHQHELIQTQMSSEAVLRLNTGTELQLGQNSRFAAENDLTKSDALLGTLVEGTAIILNPGDTTRFRLFHRGREIKIEKGASTSPAQLSPTLENSRPTGASTVPKENELGLIISATTADETQTPAYEESTDSGREKPPHPSGSSSGSSSEPSSDSSSSSLSNEEIIRRFRAQSGFFQRCYLNFIQRLQKDSPQAAVPSGAVITSFKIETNGRVTETKVTRSDFNDSVLHRCLTEVIERTRFSSFTGKAVPVEEFPISLQ